MNSEWEMARKMSDGQRLDRIKRRGLCAVEEIKGVR